MLAVMAFVAVALFGWRQMVWIEERGQVLEASNQILSGLPAEEIARYEPTNEMSEYAKAHLPFSLRLLGETPRPWLVIRCDEDKNWKQEKARIARLFLEARIGRYMKWGNNAMQLIRNPH